MIDKMRFLILLAVMLSPTVSSCIYGQNIYIGSGFENDHVVIRVDSDTIHDGIVTSLDHIDIFTSVPVSKKSERVEIIMNGKGVFEFYNHRNLLKKREALIIDIIPIEVGGVKVLNQVTVKIVHQD